MQDRENDGADCRSGTCKIRKKTDLKGCSQRRVLTEVANVHVLMRRIMIDVICQTNRLCKQLGISTDCWVKMINFFCFFFVLILFCMYKGIIFHVTLQTLQSKRQLF